MTADNGTKRFGPYGDLVQRIAELEAEREAADKYIKAREKDCYEYDEKVRLLEAERDALKADAERYRWLRMQSYD